MLAQKIKNESRTKQQILVKTVFGEFKWKMALILQQKKGERSVHNMKIIVACVCATQRWISVCNRENGSFKEGGEKVNSCHLGLW